MNAEGYPFSCRNTSRERGGFTNGTVRSGVEERVLSAARGRSTRSLTSIGARRGGGQNRKGEGFIDYHFPREGERDGRVES